MKRVLATSMLMLWAAAAAADPPTLEPAIGPRLSAVLAKSKLGLAAVLYQGVPVDATSTSSRPPPAARGRRLPCPGTDWDCRQSRERPIVGSPEHDPGARPGAADQQRGLWRW